MKNQEKSAQFYANNYDVLASWLVQPGKKIILGKKEDRKCRFCGKRPPEVSFRKIAHAIPEALGNKSIQSLYECDSCNEAFGNGIENDLGNWSKPVRTFARIRGKRGVPTLKKGGDLPGWRIEYEEAGFQISAYEDDPIFTVDEEKRRITFKLKRDPFTPVAVLKAFMKIGLTLLPEEEVKNFLHLMAWVRNKDHRLLFAERSPIICSFIPGPRPNDRIEVFILRRKPHVNDYPYAYLVLSYGNEVFQVQLPSQEYDQAMNGRSFEIYPFPVAVPVESDQYGPVTYGQIDLTGRKIVRGEIVSLVLGYEVAVPKND